MSNPSDAVAGTPASLIEVWRGPIVESRHRGHLTAVDGRGNTIAALGLPESRVNVKATTGETIGFVGRGEGVAALACAGLRSPE